MTTRITDIGRLLLKNVGFGEIVFLLHYGQQARFASCPTASGPVNIR